MKKYLLFMCLFFASAMAFDAAAQIVVQGRVTSSDDGEPLPGVNVLVENTTKGTVTDVDGNYSITLDGDENVLVFSFIGFATERISVSGRSVIDVSLASDITSLDEVVVIGYGTLQERELTTAITTLKTEEITKTPTGQAMQALQGKVAGVQIVSNGAPGAAPTVRVRGIGSFEGNAAPLYVVDGMFFDNIDFLNTNDIATISILKDASASAIYGMRAANGVVLIETKSGAYGQEPEIVYDGYVGIQVPQNVIKMANSEQFVRYINEVGDPADLAFVDNAFQRYGRSRVNPNVPDVNTDWYDEVMDPSTIQNHSLSFNGGSESTRYSIGGSYFDQQGLLNETRNEFKRLTFRAKLDTDVKKWLTVGGNLNVSMARQYVGENAAWFDAYFAVPIMPVYDEQNSNASPFRLANARQLGYRNRQNPFFPLLYNDNRNNIGKVLGNFHLDVHLLEDKLSFKTVYNYSMEAISARNVDFNYSDGMENVQSALVRETVTSFDQVWDNYATYRDNWGAHNLTLVAGYSFRSEYRELLYARGTEIQGLDRDQEEFWYLSRAANININDIRDTDGNTLNSRLFYQSVFGRLAYNYDGRYLLYSTFRRDGNNKFQTKYGNFATFGAGWVLSEEAFFDVGFIDFLKFRGGWGQLGNDGIRPAEGSPTFDEGRLTVINGAPVTGRFLNPAFDRITAFEKTEEINVGITANLLASRLSFEADYFIRDTKDLAVNIILPGFREPVRRSVGEIRNTGFEFSIDWSDRISDKWAYSVGGNLATLENEVRGLGGAKSLNAGSAEFRQISIVGEPFEAFYGYELVGVFQNEQQISNSGYTQEFLAENNLQPGDFYFKDQNGDGVIDDEDRVILGSYLPDLTYGFNIAVSYGNFDLTAHFQGQAGNSILNRKRGEIIFTNDTNLDAELADNLWRGDGTSNKYPSAAGLRKGWNQNMSEYFVENGSYFRVQNVRLSYLFKGQILGSQMPETRITLTAERLLTVFDYNGFNPEVADGIDRQVYPIPAIYTVGLNIKL
ncbi:TonB-dependent receptor [Fulvivirga imtechensis AK7]|uniref:TonB-dependent receptor n=1 Tax=Fulvivirga imtechensis AK7 TaxID=1237149 RepID=L8JPV6_9BACT|nr:TonB-dependent receptor [Fulvivirga imtechensis]ELR69539.1 TonB-dependent receptor [Fulvivirga imtechensis AK7]